MMNENLEPFYLVRSEIPSICSILFQRFGDKRYLFCGTENGGIYKWNLETPKPSKKPLFQAGSSHCIALTSLHDRIISQEKSGPVRIWTNHESSWTKTHEFGSRHFGFCKIDVSDYMGGVVLCPDSQSKLDIYNETSLNKIMTLDPSVGENSKFGVVVACKLIYSYGIPYVLTAYENEELCLWDLKKEQIVSKCKIGAIPTAFDFDNDRSEGLCGTVSKNLHIFTLQKDGNFTKEAKLVNKAGGIGCVKIHAESDLGVVSFWNESLQFIRWSKKRLLTPKKVHYDTIQDICFSPWPVPYYDADCLMTAASKNSQLSLWTIF